MLQGNEPIHGRAMPALPSEAEKYTHYRGGWVMDKASDYFDFILGRLGFSAGACWMIVSFKDGSKWENLGLGFYWRYTQ